MGEVIEVPREDVERAARLILWMSNYLGSMAPGRYSDCFADLNEHFIAMQRLGLSEADPSKG